LGSAGSQPGCQPTMSNHKEEQELELEALESIFEEGKEFEKISDTEFLLKFKPYPQDEQENFVGVTLRIAYTDEYPDVAPEWELKDIVGLSDPKVEEMKSKVEESIGESLGMAMVYTVAEMCQEWLKENNVKALSMHEEMMLRNKGDEPSDDDEDDEDNEAEVDKLEEEEWKGLKEKPLCAKEDRITSVSFLEWKLKFDEEMIANGTLKREEQKAKTGKMIFMEAQAAEIAEGKAPGAVAKEGGELAYNAALFGDEEEVDLDDLDDEEEDGDEFFDGLTKDEPS